MPDYYAILEVSPTATATEIRRSYRRLARLHHPDLNQQTLDIHIKRLNEAYEVLRDPLKRAAYDQQLAEEKRRAAEGAALGRKQEQERRESEMSWAEGIVRFVREFKKGLQDE